MEKMILDGIWDFGWTEDAAKVPYFDSVASVPGCADALRGIFGHWGFASYRRNVKAGGPVRLEMMGGMRYKVLWDGKKVGASVLPWTPEGFEFDAGKEGVHELIIICENEPDRSDSSMFHTNSPEPYDFYCYCGIYDNVTLTKLREGEIDRVEVLPISHETGEVKVRVAAYGKAPAKLIYAFDGGAVTELPYQTEFTVKVPNFKLWSPEHPNLHTIEVNGVEKTFGIRTIDYSRKILKLNGKELKLVGYNRHEAHPEFGAATPPALIWNDLMLIKNNGCNFVRGCHYAQREITLDFADKLGLLVWDEALGWGNSAKNLADKVFCDNQEEQCRKMVRKSINHPSVIMWGFLNECASDTEEGIALVTRLYNTIKSMDPSRPVTFASNRCERCRCREIVDIVSMNFYPDWYEDDLLPRDLSRVRTRILEVAKTAGNKPFIVSEIGCSALPGDHSGFRWSEEYQAEYVTSAVKTVMESPECAGIALWMFCDTKTYITTTSIVSRPRGFNNKGSLNEFRNPKMAYISVGKYLKEKGC